MQEVLINHYHVISLSPFSAFRYQSWCLCVVIACVEITVFGSGPGMSQSTRTDLSTATFAQTPEFPQRHRILRQEDTTSLPFRTPFLLHFQSDLVRTDSPGTQIGSDFSVSFRAFSYGPVFPSVRSPERFRLSGKAVSPLRFFGPPFVTPENR